MFDGQFFPSGIQPVQFDGGRPYNRWLRKDLKEIIDGLGLSTGLKLCLDAGDSSSYTSGQSWLDLSGNGYDFFRGGGSGAEASDPTFNGSAGGLSSAEFWSFDGADYFAYDQAGNETWMEQIHKNGGVCTIVCLINPAIVATSQGIVGTHTNSTTVGFDLRLTSGGTPQFVVANGAGNVNDTPVTGNLSAGAWHFVAISYDESVGAGGIKWNVDGTPDTDDATVASPSAAAARAKMSIGSFGGAFSPLLNGSKLGGLMMWDSALAAGSLASLYAATRGRFGV